MSAPGYTPSQPKNHLHLKGRPQMTLNLWIFPVAVFGKRIRKADPARIFIRRKKGPYMDLERLFVGNSAIDRTIGHHTRSGARRASNAQRIGHGRVVLMLQEEMDKRSKAHERSQEREAPGRSR
jgi:hypothetical protein